MATSFDQPCATSIVAGPPETRQRLSTPQLRTIGRSVGANAGDPPQRRFSLRRNLAGGQFGEQLGGRNGHQMHRSLERRRCCIGGLLHTADLADVLTRRRFDLVGGGGRLEPAQGGDIPAHSDTVDRRSGAGNRRSPAARTRVRAGGALSPSLFAVFCLLTFVFVGGEVGFSGWIYSYAYALGLGTEQTAGILTSFYWLGITLGRVAAIVIATRFKPNRIVLANLTGLVASLGLILLNPASPIFLWIGSLCFGFFLAPIFPTTFAFLERKTPITGSAAGVLWASGSFGAMVYPWVMGLQLEHTGPVSIMVTLAVSFGMSLVLFGWVSRQ